MRKRLIIFSLSILLFGCGPSSVEENPKNKPLPAKSSADSTLMSESVINVLNLDDFLFREDTYYVDTREINQWLEEGHVAGFVNIPF